jgi:hypothetical protein
MKESDLDDQQHDWDDEISCSIRPPRDGALHLLRTRSAAKRRLRLGASHRSPFEIVGGFGVDFIPTLQGGP